MKKTINNLRNSFTEREILTIGQQLHLRGGDGEDLRRPCIDGDGNGTNACRGNSGSNPDKSKNDTTTKSCTGGSIAG